MARDGVIVRAAFLVAGLIVAGFVAARAQNNATFPSGGGGGSPGGANTDCQFNSSGSFGGDSGCTYGSGTMTLSTSSIAPEFGDGSNFCLKYNSSNADTELFASNCSTLTSLRVGTFNTSAFVQSSAGLRVYNGGTIQLEMDNSAQIGVGGFYNFNAGVNCWSSTNTAANGGSPDSCFQRLAAGVIGVSSAYNSNTPSEMSARSYVSGGTVPGISGCSAGTQTGGGTVGSFNSGTTGTCTVILTFAYTAPTGWSCWANDLTTPADVIHQSGVTNRTTTATLTGTTVSGDVINFGCLAY